MPVRIPQVARVMLFHRGAPDGQRRHKKNQSITFPRVASSSPAAFRRAPKALVIATVRRTRKPLRCPYGFSGSVQWVVRTYFNK
jgi:hypothetical protein